MQWCRATHTASDCDHDHFDDHDHYGRSNIDADTVTNHFFDDTGQWLLCATHGAAYRPDSGACGGGPCRGGLVKIALSEREGVVHWHTAHNLLPIEF